MKEDIKKLWDAWEAADKRYFEDEDNEDARIAMEETENELASKIRLIFAQDLKSMKTMLHCKKKEVKAKLESEVDK